MGERKNNFKKRVELVYSWPIWKFSHHFSVSHKEIESKGSFWVSVLKKCLDKTLRHMMWVLGCPVQSQELVLMTLMGVFQLCLFHASVISPDFRCTCTMLWVRFCLWWISKSLGRRMRCSSLSSVFRFHEIRAAMPLKAAGLIESHECWHVITAFKHISDLLLCSLMTAQFKDPGMFPAWTKHTEGTESLLAHFYALTHRFESCAMDWGRYRVLSHCHKYFFRRQSSGEGA